MPNPVFEAMNSGGQNNLMSQFRQFVESMKGINPNEEIQRLLRSGQINQQQLNEAQQMAQQMRGLFSMFK